MKLSTTTKPISCPGRMVDKFPPPLMTFLRTNAANKSRRGARSRTTKTNSIFLILRKKSTAPTSIETKEPSSPKVTCMGQVRPKQPTTKKNISGNGPPVKRRCHFWWVTHTLFCSQSVKCCIRFRRKGKASKVSEASMKNRSKESEKEEQEVENRVVVKAKGFVSNSNDCSTPPKNAFLLTRCKSAPYSSSSLASRFWGSPLRTEQETEQPCSEKQSESMRFFEEVEDSVRERKRKEDAEGECVAFPLVLTRCKSERTRKI